MLGAYVIKMEEEILEDDFGKIESDDESLESKTGSSRVSLRSRASSDSDDGSWSSISSYDDYDYDTYSYDSYSGEYLNRRRRAVERDSNEYYDSRLVQFSPF